MTDKEALKYLKDANRKNDMLCVLPNSDIGKCLIKALENQKTMECLLEKAAEEIENIYGRETELSEEIRDLLDDLN